jgi:hypothetical protein
MVQLYTTLPALYIQVGLFVFVEDLTSWTIFMTHIHQNPPSLTWSPSPHLANVTAILHKTAHLTMNITCLVKDSPEPPQFIFWYHQDQVGNKVC